MDLLDSISFLDKNWNECINDDEISDAIDKNTMDSLNQKLSKDEILNQVSCFMTDFSQKKDTSQLIKYSSDISKCCYNIINNIAYFTSLDFSLFNLNKETRTILQNIDEAKHFYTDLLPLFSKKNPFKKKVFFEGNDDKKNLEYLSKLKETEKLINIYPELNTMFPRLGNFKNILENTLTINSIIIINSFSEETIENRIEQIKEYFKYQYHFMKGSRQLDDIKIKSLKNYARNVVIRELCLNKNISTCSFYYNNNIVNKLLQIEQLKPSNLPKLSTNEISKEIKLVYFVVNLDNISQSKIENLNSIFTPGLLKVFMDELKEVLLNSLNTFETYYRKHPSVEMPWCFFYSIFSNADKFIIAEDYFMRRIILDIVKNIKDISLKNSNDHFNEYFNSNYNPISNVQFNKITFPKNIKNAGLYQSNQINYIYKYILIFKSIKPIVDQILLYKLNKMTEINWAHFMERISDHDAMKKIETIHSFYEPYVLLFYAMVNHYLISARNDDKLKFISSFQVYVQIQLIEKNESLNQKFTSFTNDDHSFNELSGLAYDFIKSKINSTENHIKEFIKVYENNDLTIFNVALKQFIIFFIETLVKYLQTKSNSYNYNDLRRNVREGFH